MAINLDNTIITLDFGYTDDAVDYKIRFHQTKELGDTISLSENGSDYLSYPAAMIMDIGIFVKEQHLIKNGKTEDGAEKDKKPDNKISSFLSPKLSVSEEIGVSGFGGGLAIPQIEGESEILLSDQLDDQSDDDKNSNDIIIKKFAENIEELTAPEIKSGELTEDDVEKEWLMRDKKPDVGTGKTIVKRS